MTRAPSSLASPHLPTRWMTGSSPSVHIYPASPPSHHPWCAHPTPEPPTVSPQDYVYVAYFLICTSTFLKIRWWVGTLVLLAPMLLADLWHRDSLRKVGLSAGALDPPALLRAGTAGAAGVHAALADAPATPAGRHTARATALQAAHVPALHLHQLTKTKAPRSLAQVHTLPHDALVHMIVAWAVGGLMAYLAGAAPGACNAVGWCEAGPCALARCLAASAQRGTRTTAKCLSHTPCPHI